MSGQLQDWEIKKAAAWWLVQRDPLVPSSLYLKAATGPETVVKA
jgi:phosphohistidine phosphatase